MVESDLVKYVEGRFVNIENAIRRINTEIKNITDILYDKHHRIESIEAAMEKMLDIIRAHDDLLTLPD